MNLMAELGIRLSGSRKNKRWTAQKNRESLLQWPDHYGQAPNQKRMPVCRQTGMNPDRAEAECSGTILSNLSNY